MSLRRNTLHNLAGNGLPLLAGAVTVPFLMRQLGTEKFGIVTLIWTIIGYLSLFDFGLGRALTQLTANNIGTGRAHENHDLLNTSVYLTLLAGCCGALGLIGLAHPLAYQWLHISSPSQLDSFRALALTALAVPITTVSAAYRGALEGHEQFRDVNQVRVFFGIASFLFPALSVLLIGANLLSVTFSLIIARLITFAFFLSKLRAVYSGYRFSLKRSTTHWRRLFSFGSWMTLSNIVSPIMVSADRFLISGIMGAATVAYYTVPFEIIVRFLIIPGAIGSSLFPRLSALYGSSPAEANRLIRKASFVTAGVLLACTLVIALGYHPAVSLWINREFADKSYWIAVILACGALVNGIAYIYYTAVQAKDGARATGILHLIELGAYVPLLIFMIHRFGILGAAGAWSIRITLDCIFLHSIYSRTRAS